MVVWIIVIVTIVCIFALQTWMLGRINNNKRKSYEPKKEGFGNQAKIGIATCVRKPIDFSLWLKHHRNIGVSRFYIRVEDTPELEEYLAKQPDIILEMGESDKSGNNYKTIQSRQVKFVNQSLSHALQKKDIDWLFNIDCDELLYSENRENPFGWLNDLDTKYKTLKLKNIEAVYDGTETHCFSCKKFRKCGEDGVKCRAYSNGKGGGRVVTGVTQIGCHDFGMDGKHQGDFVHVVPYKSMHVLHFDSCSFGAWAEKFKHMSHNQQSEIPFDYYHESMSAVKQAWETYAKHTQSNEDDGEIVRVNIVI